MEKGNTEMAISFGLVDGADVLLSNWNGGILGPHGVSFTCVSYVVVAVVVDWSHAPRLFPLLVVSVIVLLETSVSGAYHHHGRHMRGYRGSRQTISLLN